MRASEGGTDGLNSGVRRMIGAATTCADAPEVQAAACGDAGALDIDGASTAQLTKWAKAAAGGGYDELLRKLLEAGADPLTEAGVGMTPLTAAAQAGHGGGGAALPRGGAGRRGGGRQAAV